MSSAQSALEEFAGGAAHEAAQGAADTLEQLIAQCHSMGEQGKGAIAFQTELAQEIGDTVDQLLAAAGLGGGSGSGWGGYSMRRNSLRNGILLFCLLLMVRRSSRVSVCGKW